MRITVTLFSLAMVAFLSACTRAGMLPPREVTVENTFSLAIPANLKPCLDLHEFAPLQFADEVGGYFLVGIDEPKHEMEYMQVHYTLEDYAYFVESTIAGAYDTSHVSHRDTLEINGLNCHTADLYVAAVTDNEQVEVYYHLAIFESANHFYQLIGWTSRDHQALFRETAEAMDRSFHEIETEVAKIQTASVEKGD